MEDNKKIDIVILWVDGNDKNWLEEKAKYESFKGDKSKNRFRDFGNLQYLFRGIEKYADFVNKVFFITWGHIPKWLNVKNEKLRIVKHEEFIPNKYLPTFNSNVIEMNLHRIKDLSEQFILFNDDLFILNKLEPSYFFQNGKPKDMYIEYQKKNRSHRNIVMRNNYFNILNNYFTKGKFIKNNINKVFNLKYGIKNLKTLSCIFKAEFQDIYSEHLTQPFLKTTFEKMWNNEYEKLNSACFNKFRADTDIGQNICRYYELLSGNFVPRKKLGKYFILKNDNSKLIRDIINRKYKIICINDALEDLDFEKCKLDINNAFSKVFKEKSSFEI